MSANENPAGTNGGASELCHAAKLTGPESKPTKASGQARCISASGPAELGEPTYSRQQLGRFNQRYVERLRAAIANGSESAVEGVDRRPGTRNPKSYNPNPGAVP
jgi:hypothetical protein